MRNAIPPLVLLAILVSCWTIYQPGLSGAFLFDDFPNLEVLGRDGRVEDVPSFLRYLGSGISSPTGRPLALASFLIDDNQWPAVPRGFLRTNVLLHLLCGCVLLMMNLQLLRALRPADPAGNERVAVAAAALWLLHPFWVSTTLYVVQRMTILCAIFVFAGVALYCNGRRRLQETPGQPWPAYRRMNAAIVVFTPLAVLSKENGALLPLLLWTVDTALSRPVTTDQLRFFRAWKAVMLAFPSAVMLIYTAYTTINSWEAMIGFRGFDPVERLLSQGRIVLGYLYDLAIPKMESGGIFQDNIRPNRGWVPGPANAISWLVLITALAAAWRVRRRWPLVFLGAAFFAAGHVLESTTLNLELAFEHRNYLPAAPLFLALADIALKRSDGSLRRAGVAGLLVSMAVCTSFTWSRAKLWGNPQEMYLVWAEKAPNSMRAQTTAAQYFLRHGHPDLAEPYLQRALRNNPDDAISALIQLTVDCTWGRETQAQLDSLGKLLLIAPYHSVLVRYLEQFVEGSLIHNCKRARPEALADIPKALLDNPNVARRSYDARREVFYLMGIYSAALGRWDEAAQRFQTSADTGFNYQAGLSASVKLARGGRLAEAATLLERIRPELLKRRDAVPHWRSWDIEKYNAQIAEVDDLLQQIRRDIPGT